VVFAQPGGGRDGSSPKADRLLWMAPALQEVFDDGVGRVQSSVRPVDAVQLTAGPDGVREPGPILLIRL